MIAALARFGMDPLVELLIGARARGRIARAVECGQLGPHQVLVEFDKTDLVGGEFVQDEGFDARPAKFASRGQTVRAGDQREASEVGFVIPKFNNEV